MWKKGRALVGFVSLALPNIYLLRVTVSRRGVETLRVVEIKIFRQRVSGLFGRPAVTELHFLICECAPQPFDEDVGNDPASTIRAAVDPILLPPARKISTGEPAVLFRLEDLRLVVVQSFLECHDAELLLQPVYKAVREAES